MFPFVMAVASTQVPTSKASSVVSKSLTQTQQPPGHREIKLRIIQYHPWRGLDLSYRVPFDKTGLCRRVN